MILRTLSQQRRLHYLLIRRRRPATSCGFSVHAVGYIVALIPPITAITLSTAWLPRSLQLSISGTIDSTSQAARQQLRILDMFRLIVIIAVCKTGSVRCQHVATATAYVLSRLQPLRTVLCLALRSRVIFVWILLLVVMKYGRFKYK